jgi:hypothetical protein
MMRRVITGDYNAVRHACQWEKSQNRDPLVGANPRRGTMPDGGRSMFHLPRPTRPLEAAFVIDPFEPACLGLQRAGLLAGRAAVVVQELGDCRACPRECGVDRLADETGACFTGRHAVRSSAGSRASFRRKPT